MHRIATMVRESLDGSPVVAWALGTRRTGLVVVEGLLGTEDLEASAELVAIRYLLFTAKIFGGDHFSGKGLEFKVSSPVVKKVFRNKTTKKHLLALGRFIQTNLDGASVVSIGNDTDHLPHLGDDVPVEFADAGDDIPVEVFETPKIGKVKLTRHAIDQLSARVDDEAIKNPAASLISRLKHPHLKQHKLSDKVTRHKLRRYGSHSHTEVWGHDSSDVHFVVVRNEGSDIATVVTVFVKALEYVL